MPRWPTHIYRVTEHPLYKTWLQMNARCHYPPFHAFHLYGGRGIEVFPEWRRQSRPFIDWVEANLGSRPAGYTLDRIDNDRGYEPGNLRWATKQQQAWSRRKTIWVEVDGTRYALLFACVAVLGLSKGQFNYIILQLRKGKPLDQIMAIYPVGNRTIRLLNLPPVHPL